jgi:hypothetical protein
MKAASHTPELLNAEHMARRHPNTFLILGRGLRSALSPGQCAKLCTGGERFWAKVTLTDGKGQYTGQVDNAMSGLGHHGLNYGDVITFEAKHVLDIYAPSRDKAEAWT